VYNGRKQETLEYCALYDHLAHMKSPLPILTDDELGLEGPFDSPSDSQPWFLPADMPESADELGARRPGPRAGLIDTAAWVAAEGGVAADLAALAFDLGRLSERLRLAGSGAIQRLALAEAASLSWFTGDRVTADRLALWLSYRIGAAEEGGEDLIRIAWAARRLMAAGKGMRGATEMLRDGLGEEGRVDPGLVVDVAAEIAGLAGVNAITRACAQYHLWRALEERPDHLRGLEAAVLGARAAGQGSLPFLPLSLTGSSALTASGSTAARLAAWITGAHRAVLSALMLLERLADWAARATAATNDLQGRTAVQLIAALTAHPMLGVPQAVSETGASRAAVQRNLDILLTRGLVREVTGHGRFRVWAAKM
jgi:hypothetical protein